MDHYKMDTYEYLYYNEYYSMNRGKIMVRLIDYENNRK